MQPYTAQLDQYELRILDISDTISASLVKQEFLNTDGAKITNLGNKAREIKFRAFFFGIEGNETAATYPNHYTFLEEMSDSSLYHVLVHPKYGRIEGFIDSLTLIHDDTQNYVAIDIVFTQKDIQLSGYIENPYSLTYVMDANALANLNAGIIKARQSMIQQGLGAVAGIPIAKTRSILSQISSVSHKISQVTRNFCRECDTFLNYMDSYAAAITSPINTLDAAVNYVGDLPSRIIGSINGVCNRIVNTGASLTNLPTALVNSIVMQSRDLLGTIKGEHADFFRTQFLNVSAGAISRESGYLIQADQNKSTLSKAAETSSAFDVHGNRLAKMTIEQTMTIQDLEALLYTARNYVQMAIVNDRSNVNLVVMTKALAEFFNTIKLTKRSQQTVTVNSIPLHLLMMQLGLPYNMAERIYKLNPNIKNPTFCSGPIKVYTNV